MPLYLYNGDLLISDDKLAIDENCCCVEYECGECTDCTPAYLTIDPTTLTFPSAYIETCYLWISPSQNCPAPGDDEYFGHFLTLNLSPVVVDKCEDAACPCNYYFLGGSANIELYNNISGSDCEDFIENITYTQVTMVHVEAAGITVGVGLIRDAPGQCSGATPDFIFLYGGFKTWAQIGTSGICSGLNLTYDWTIDATSPINFKDCNCTGNVRLNGFLTADGGYLTLTGPTC